MLDNNRAVSTSVEVQPPPVLPNYVHRKIRQPRPGRLGTVVRLTQTLAQTPPPTATVTTSEEKQQVLPNDVI